MISSHTSADETSNGIFLIRFAQSWWARRSRSRGLERGEVREFVSGSSHLATQPVKNGQRGFFGPWGKVACGTNAGRATFIAHAGGDQFARFVDEKFVRPIERLGEAYASGIRVIQIKIGLEEFF